jgi:hypothetical protein
MAQKAIQLHELLILEWCCILLIHNTRTLILFDIIFDDFRSGITFPQKGGGIADHFYQYHLV